jgi:lipoprotein-releasing system permease protein
VTRRFGSPRRRGRTWSSTSSQAVAFGYQRGWSLFALPGGATTIEFKVSDVFDAERVAAEVNARTQLDADSWMKLNAELLTGLSAQSSSKTMIQFFVVLTVALGIASVLIVSVVH